MAAPSSGWRTQPAPSSSQLTANARTNGGVDADASYALAETALRTGLSVIPDPPIWSATDCLFALAAGGGATAAVQGVVLTGLGIGGVIRTDIAVRVLRPRGSMLLLAAVFAVAGFLDVGLQRHFAEVAAAIVCVAALICATRWVVLCCAVSAAGFLGALALHGSSLAWMIGDGATSSSGSSSTWLRTLAPVC